MAALSPGTRLGVYEVVEAIGAGGMGEVYRARDTKLGRDVAIKVLPEDFSADAERLARFRREAQVLASLNHPNIAAIYGTEDNALILELVEGPTLAERIAQGPIPLEEAIAIARQIAEALEAAHEAGIIHRDLKPPNVKVQEDGTVKVLDFGLAKAIEGEAKGDSSESPTLTGAATRAGVIMGTAAYMSPEQAKGKKVNRRADVWAFGAVLYEMLTGKRPFDGEDISDTLAAVLRAEPEWDALPAALAPTLRTYLIRCLEKDPKQRVPDIGVVRLAMEGAFEADAPPASAAPRSGWRALGVALILGALVGAALLSLLSLLSSTPDAPRPLARFVIDSSSEFLPRGEVAVAITPDGTRIIYRRVTPGRNELVVRALDELESTSLVVEVGFLSGPFLSPDGKWVGYFDGPVLQKVSILGGPPVTICALPAGGSRGASWRDDNTIIFATARPGGLWRVPAGGGEPEELTTPDAGQGGHRSPEILPGGEAVLFGIAGTSDENNQIAVLTLDSGETRILVPGGSNPRYAPSGHIVYGVGRTLRAVGFDLDALEVTTDPVPVLEGVVGGFGSASFDMSQNGSLVYVVGPRERDVERTLVWVDREGSEEALAAEPRAYTYPRISPDGTRLALDVRDQEQDIWIWDFARETLTRLTFDPTPDYYPAWTPDGARVAFGSSREGVFNLFWKAADGTGTVEQLTESATLLLPQTFSPDGTQLIFRESAVPAVNLGVRSMDTDGTLESLLASEFNEQNAEIAPDGNWLAFDSNASGQFEIYVRPFPNVDEGRWQISQGGGTQPLWGPDGRELFYVTPTGQLTAVPIETDPFAPGNPEVVLERSYLSRPGGIAVGRTYDVSPDGKRFLMIKDGGPGDETEPTQLILVQNWLDELKRLVPVHN